MLLLGLLVTATSACVTEESEVRTNAASDMECDSRIDVTHLSESSWLATGCGESQRYRCETHWFGRTRDITCRPTGEGAPLIPLARPSGASAASPLLEPPTGAGGFWFGEREEQVRAACEKATHAYASDGLGVGSCDGLVADVGAPAAATFAYCDGAVCEVSLHVQPAANENIGQAVVRWKGALTAKYGGATTSNLNVPAACRGDVIPCLRDGKSTVQFDWQWGSYRRISLKPKAEGQDRAAVEIAYVAWGAPENAPAL